MNPIDPELSRVQSEYEHIRRISTLLVRHDTDACIHAVIVQQCATALGADAVCLFFLRDDDHYEMVEEVGCTPEFKSQWRRIPKDYLPLVQLDDPHDCLFIGSADEFKAESPTATHLVDNSKRKVVAYAPLVVKQIPIGVLGFSYNQVPAALPDRKFVSAIVNLVAQAIERVRLFERERRAREDAECANRAKTNFLANISHEIRTPLTAIKGFADLIASSKGLSADQKHWTDRILKNARHLTGLIGDILDISKIESEAVEVNRCYFSLAELIEDVRAATVVNANEKNLYLNFTFDSTIEIFTDPAHLRQILINLIGNSIKFTLKGGIDVRFEIDRPNSNSASILKITVQDSGIGIPPSDREKIFEPFTQAFQPGQLFGGTGLGLYISKRLARILGGELSLEQSTPGAGTTFCFKLFCPATVAQPHDSGVSLTRPCLEGFRILLAEDAPDNRYLLNHVLSELGARVDFAENGQEAIDKATAQPYDVIVMDIQMPVLDGNQATAELRARGLKIPVIALTACALASEREKSLQFGVNDYLTKPIDFMKLIHAVERYGTEAKRSKFHEI